MADYLATLEYNGQGFSGWQKQPGLRTVQGELEAAIRTVTGCNAPVTGAGRTDGGVHALGQAASFSIPEGRETRRLLYSLNAVLPPDVSVSSLKRVPAGFNARYAARTKIYRYRIWNRPYRSAWAEGTSWHVRQPLDIPAMRAAAALLTGEHDFSSFDAAGGSQPNKVAFIEKITIVRRNGYVVLTFRGTRFLYKMVRTMTGTLMEAGRGLRAPETLRAILESRDRTAAGRTAPPQGLCLVKVLFR